MMSGMWFILSPTLFRRFVNDAAEYINSLNIGITIHEMKLSIVLCAENIVILAENGDDLKKKKNCVFFFIYFFVCKLMAP